MKTTHCHHCGKVIAWNRHWKGTGYSGGHWAHAITVHGGRSHSIENALMEQRCAGRQTWATPARAALALAKGE